MLGCIQPMSSPMMKRMFGFCCWAAAGALAAVTTASEARQPSQAPLLIRMVASSMSAARDGPAASARWHSRRALGETTRTHFGAVGMGRRLAASCKSLRRLLEPWENSRSGCGRAKLSIGEERRLRGCVDVERAFGVTIARSMLVAPKCNCRTGTDEYQ